MPSLTLVGSVSSQIGNLTFLRRIDLGNNSFHSEIPQELGKLFRLQYLLLLNNSFQGEFPTNLTHCSHLRVIDMGGNTLGGKIPTELGSLSNLSHLGLAVNHFTGTIPLSIGNLSNLRVLSLGSNNLEGRIPTQLGQLYKLEVLQLSINKLSGEFPTNLTHCSNLRLIRMGDNNLGGKIPTELGSLSNLSNLNLAANRLTGTIPLSIGNLSNLRVLSLMSNNLEGSIPTKLGQLDKLKFLQLSENNLSGSIPNSIGKLSMLEILILGTNSISGVIPSSIRNLSRLGALDLSTNMIEGSIPISLGNCTNLLEIYLDYNNLTGAIPYQIFGLSSLNSLYLSQNYLTGLLPQEVGNLKNLGALHVSKNKLFGEIPTPLGNCEVLEFLYIDGNLFEGTIPTTFRQLKAILYQNRRSRQQVNLASPLKNQYPQLSYGELFQATNGFSPSNLIGEGGYGSVYKGILNSDEQIIAVKVLKLHEHGANKSFVTECEALKNIRHRNLVKIITACSSIDFKGNNFKALVFEFMENGSLENWLHPSLLEQHEPKNLNFVQRLNIAIDVACALDYLHHHCEMAFIHCDLKPSNILLDGDMYSYGVLLLEMFTGKRPTNNMFTSNVNLHSYVQMCLPEQVMQIVDPQIILEMEEEPSEMENSPLLKIAEQDLHQLGLLQQAVHHLFPHVLLQLSTQTSSTSSAISRGVNCCLAANYYLQFREKPFAFSYPPLIGVLIEDKEFVDSCMGGKPWKAGKFSSSLRLTLWSEHLRLPAGESYEEPWCPLITQLISLCAFNHPQMLSRQSFSLLDFQ
ncbi:hypothetical protein ACSBR1_041193 [Camellia fascicularis]